MTITLVPDTRTDRDAIARGMAEVYHAEHEATLWRELADFLAEPLALHNLLAEPVNRTADDSVEVRWQNVTRAVWVPVVPHRRDAALATLGARVQASIEAEPEPEHVLTDVAPRRGGKYRRQPDVADPPWWQRAIDHVRRAWADETGAPA